MGGGTGCRPAPNQALQLCAQPRHVSCLHLRPPQVRGLCTAVYRALCAEAKPPDDIRSLCLDCRVCRILIFAEASARAPWSSQQVNRFWSCPVRVHLLVPGKKRLPEHVLWTTGNRAILCVSYPGCSSLPCSRVGDTLTDFPAHNFQCLFPALLSFAVISGRSRDGMCFGSYWRLVEVAEATQRWQRQRKDEVTFPLSLPADLDSFLFFFKLPSLYISYPWLIYCATGSLYLLISLTYFSPSPAPQQTWIPLSSLPLCGFGYMTCTWSLISFLLCEMRMSLSSVKMKYCLQIA